MGGGDLFSEFLRTLSTEPLASVCGILFLGIVGQFFLARKDVAAKDREIAAMTRERLADAKVLAEKSNEATIKLHDALDLVSRLEPIRARRGG